MANKGKRTARAKGTGSLIKRRGHYFFRNTVNGKRLEQALFNENGTPCTTQPDAEKAAKKQDRTLLELDTQEKVVQKIAELHQLKVIHQAKSSDVWQLYLNSATRPDASPKVLAEQRGILEHFGTWMAKHYQCGLDGVTPMAASRYMFEKGEQVSNRTFDGYAMTLKLIFKTVFKQLGMSENPFENIRHRPIETISRREFSEEQVEKIFAGFRNGFFYEAEVEGFGPGRQRRREKCLREYRPLYKDEMEVLMKLCCYTGADGQSGCLMTWENIDFEKNQITYVRHKTRKTSGRPITLPMHPVLRDALLTAQGWRQAASPHVLSNVAKRYLQNRHGVQKDAMKIIRIALGVETTSHEQSESRRALAPNIYSLHSFRHTFVSFCINAGVPLAIVSEIVGHGNPMMTKHYAHINTEAKSKAIAILPSVGLSSTPTIEQSEETRQRLLTYIEAAAPEQLAELSRRITPKQPLMLPA